MILKKLIVRIARAIRHKNPTDDAVGIPIDPRLIPIDLSEEPLAFPT